ncbi:MAG: alpha/beta fold hydrolase [Clostridia bacterium]|nr:alpha/beta fold hydrolase [Clostridia bacterium]
MIFEKQIVNGYKGMIFTRCDDTESVFYFSADDFPGLNSEKYSFKSHMGHSLQGYIYSYENPISERLVVFDHGFGGGHRAYMKEIEMLCRHGYQVFAYDHTGCMESGGESPNGLAQSLADLNDCIEAIKADERFSGMTLSVMGHSWGAFSTLNISALHSEITHVVAMCGFVSVEEMTKTFFSGILKGYRKAVFSLEQESNPKFVNFNAAESLSNSSAKALLIYSADDKLCKKSHYDILYSALNDKENVSFLLTDNKGHNPNYTESAIEQLSVFTKQRAKLLRNKKATAEDKKRFVESFDFDKMTEQDESVWRIIFEHLDS